MENNKERALIQKVAEKIYDSKESNIIREVKLGIKIMNVEVKDKCNILITTIDDAGEKVTENHEFEPDCVLTMDDRIALAVLVALGFEPEWVYQSGVLESWVEGDEDNDFMEFYGEEKAMEQTDTKLMEAKEALRKEKEEMDRKRGF